MKKPVKPFGNEVILELKFTNHYPTWFRELVHVFGCMQCGAAKYVEGAEDLGFIRMRQREDVASAEETASESGSVTIVLPKDLDFGSLNRTST